MIQTAREGKAKLTNTKFPLKTRFHIVVADESPKTHLSKLNANQRVMDLLNSVGGTSKTSPRMRVLIRRYLRQKQMIKGDLPDCCEILEMKPLRRETEIDIADYFAAIDQATSRVDFRAGGLKADLASYADVVSGSFWEADLMGMPDAKPERQVRIEKYPTKATQELFQEYEKLIDFKKFERFKTLPGSDASRMLEEIKTIDPAILNHFSNESIRQLQVK